VVRTIVKVGGGLLGRPGAFDLLAEGLTAFGVGRSALVVPGGGPFADAARELFRRFKIGDEAAHWMAILGMDQYAHALVSRIPGAELVDQAPQIAAALDAGRLPVLAPYRWLRSADPLPHSWEVTSDSIAAWIAGAVGAARVVLVKPAAGTAETLVDPQFLRVLPQGVEYVVVTVDDLSALRRALDEGRSPKGRRSSGGH